MAYLGFYLIYCVTKCGIQGRIGGSGGSNLPPEMFRFLVESEGKEVESKRKKMKGMGVGVGCKLLIYFFGLRYFRGGGGEKFSRREGREIFFLGGGVEKFSWGVEKFFLGGGEKFSGGRGLKIFFGGGVEKFSCG